MRKVVVVAVVLGALGLAPSAQAEITSVFGGELACSEDTDGVRECGSSSPRSTVATWDGVPIDVNVAFPPEPSSGPDGDFPLLIWGHGYGGAKIGFNAMRRFTDRGFAVFAMTTRGFRESCGSAAARTAGGAACDGGHIRLMDTRFEVRDAQEFAGRLADEELVDPQRVGALGGSYGGGLSMALGALKNRKMLPNGNLVPWTSPVDGDEMRIAGVTPSIPWTDLVYSLVPNGSNLDYLADSPYRGRFGVMKESLVSGLYFSGLGAPGFYVTPGGDADADLTSWFERMNAGEPYDGDPLVEYVRQELASHHSSYYIDDSTPPAPMLISSGFTDDLFPVDEALRFYNRTRASHTGTPISLFFGDFGHPRAANKPADADRVEARENAWLDFYVKGEGPTPFQGVEALTQTCPNTAPSAGPVAASNWATMAPGEVRFFSEGTRTLTPGAGSEAIAAPFNPVTSGSNPCRTAPADDQAGVATYRLPQVNRALVLMGAATVVATIDSSDANSQVAARLLDVAPDGTETLVSRALLRPPTGASRQVFQLHPNGWQFDEGHVPKLELLPRDSGSSPLASYARESDGQGPVSVTGMQLRLPVLQPPGTDGGYVKAPKPRIVPKGTQLSKDFAELPRSNARLLEGKLRIGRKGVQIAAPDAWESAHVSVKVFGKFGKGEGKNKRKLVARGKVKVKGGEQDFAKLALTKKAKRALGRAGKRRLKTQVVLTTREQTGKVKSKRTLLLPKR